MKFKNSILKKQPELGTHNWYKTHDKQYACRDCDMIVHKNHNGTFNSIATVELKDVSSYGFSFADSSTVSLNQVYHVGSGQVIENTGPITLNSGSAVDGNVENILTCEESGIKGIIE